MHRWSPCLRVINFVFQVGASLPDKLNRPAWYLDFPKWQETAKGMWMHNGEKGATDCLFPEHKAEVIQVKFI